MGKDQLGKKFRIMIYVVGLCLLAKIATRKLQKINQFYEVEKTSSTIDSGNNSGSVIVKTESTIVEKL